MLKRTKVKHTDEYTASTFFFVLLSVHAIGKTDSTSYSVLIRAKMDDKLTKLQTNDGQTQIKMKLKSP